MINQIERVEHRYFSSLAKTLSNISSLSWNGNKSREGNTIPSGIFLKADVNFINGPNEGT